MKKIIIKSKYKTLSIYPVMFIILMTSILINGVKAESNHAYHIETRFMLWDSQEKILDTDFTIHIYSNILLNDSIIHSNDSILHSYRITIDNDVQEGNFTFHESFNYSFSNNHRIMIFKIEIDNIVLVEENEILILGGISESGIRRSTSSFTISLSPFEWNNLERNIVLSVITASLFSILMGYRGLKYIRKKAGVKIHRD